MRTLGKIVIVGTEIPVVLATEEEVGPTVFGEYNFAAYEWETATIFLRKWPDKVRHASARFGDLVHEAVHALLLENGGNHLFATWLPELSTEAREEFEEQLVRAIAPAIVTALDSLNDMRNTLAALEASELLEVAT